PLFFALVGLDFAFVRDRWREGPPFIAAIQCAAVVPVIVLGAPLVNSLYLLGSFNLIGGLMVAVALLAALMVPQLCLIVRAFPKGLPIALATAALVLMILGNLKGKPDPNHRVIDDVCYVLDQDSGHAQWVSRDPELDEFTAQFLKAPVDHIGLSRFFPWYQAAAISSAALPANIPPPELRIIADETSDGVRTVHFQVTSIRNGPLMVLKLSNGVQVLGGTINSQPIPEGDGGEKGLGADPNPPSDQVWSLLFAAAPRDGFDLLLRIKQQGKLTVTVSDVTSGLPEIPGSSYKPRPDYVMPAPYLGISDTTIVTKSFEINPKP
ncbi:MAG TPA: hypothetical protein VJX67_01465, partial [Blastocatellia bacterium]|nr:hypothetical protein [Blastocatellia bacterium]